MSTPLMRQYQQVKAKYPGTILLFRMGDFFETFEEDAKIASKVLGITLTRRGNGAAGEVPLAGFPHHALESYLPKLLKAGYRVAVCEQLEDPRFAKGIVKRDVIEVVTPGVAFSDKILDQRRNNYLAAIALPTAIATSQDLAGLAFVDVSTGEFSAGEVPLRMLPEQIANLQPAELLVQKRDAETIQRLLKDSFSGIVSRLDDWVCTFDYGYELLVNHFKTQSLKGFGLEELKMAVVAAGAVMNYLQEMQKANLPHIRKVVPYDVSDQIVLDGWTKRNLEIVSTIHGAQEGTLFSIIDRTKTPMGGRLLKQWINRPLKKVEPIKERQGAVEEFVQNESMRRALTGELDGIGDLERLIAKIATGRANPRELNSLKEFLKQIPSVKTVLGECRSPMVRSLRAKLDPMEAVVGLIASAIADDPPMSFADGGVIRKGHSADLDELRTLAFSGKDWIAKLQEQEDVLADAAEEGDLMVGAN